ncbi:hypothetical protein YQE_01130, partial [Dendroctonus ponderosae]
MGIYFATDSRVVWTITLPHRTQIIYTPDISIIIMQLELRPGSVLIESGTGSGSLSHAFIRAVKPHGHLYTFDFHEVRSKTAREEFDDHGLGQYVTVDHRDVCATGFGGNLIGKADAVFLDLPHPWLAVPHAIYSLKQTGGRICSFSPCIEQVQKTCSELSKLGFQEIETMEVLQTQYNVQTRQIPVLDLDFLKTAKSDATEKKEKEVHKTLTAIPPAQQPGHTGYLTFATLYPIKALDSWTKTTKLIFWKGHLKRYRFEAPKLLYSFELTCCLAALTKPSLLVTVIACILSPNIKMVNDR